MSKHKKWDGNTLVGYTRSPRKECKCGHHRDEHKKSYQVSPCIWHYTICSKCNCKSHKPQKHYFLGIDMATGKDYSTTSRACSPDEEWAYKQLYGDLFYQVEHYKKERISVK